MESLQGGAEPPIERERNGKYSSARDEVLHAMSQDGWANQSSGDVQSITGFFARITVTPAELAEVVDAFTKVAHDAELQETEELVGHWLLLEDDQGFVSVINYETEAEVIEHYEQLDHLYGKWLEAES